MLRSLAEDLAAQRAAARVGCPQTRPRVKPSLTRPGKRPCRHRENGDYGAMVLRIIRAYGKRVVVADPEDLAPMHACLTEFGDTLRASILDARAAEAHLPQGERAWTWERIALACGLESKQAAFGRWGRL
jgi:hypothetical protein